MHYSARQLRPIAKALDRVRGEHGRAERALTGFPGKDERYQLMVEMAPYGIALLGLDGLILDVNGAIERLLGLARAEIVGRPCEPFTHPGDHDRERPLLAQTLEGRREGYTMEKRYLRHDGSTVWAKLAITLIRDERGRPSQLLALIEDIDDRHQLDEALRESESRYRSIFHESGSGIVLLTPTGTVVQANAASAEMLGVDRRDLKGREIGELVAPADREASQVEPGGQHRYERRLELDDGTHVVVDVRLTAIGDGDGGVRFLLAILDDVTEQRRLTDELRQSRDDLKLALDAGGAGTWAWVVGSAEVVWSDELERIHGLAPGEFGGRFEDAVAPVHPDDREHAQEALRRTLEEDADYRVEYRIVRPDGELAWLEAKGRVQRDEAGRPVAMTGLCTDVTERNRLEEERRSSAETLRNLIATSPLAITSLDRTGCVLLWNQAAEAMYGWTADEVLGRPLPTVPPQAWPPLRIDLAAQFEGRITHQGTSVVRRRKDGSPIEIELWTSPLRDARGAVVAQVSLQADASERRHLEQRLAQSERLEAIGKLAGGVADDFNDLLAAITGHADAALAAEELPRHTRNELTQLRLASERAADIVRQLLALSGKQVLKPALVDLNDVVAEVEQMLPALIGYEVRLRVDRGSTPLPVVADRGQLAQVLVNLVANARDAMPQGGELAIVCDAAALDEEQAAAAGCSPGAYSRIRVSDTGIGMDEVTRARVFEPFFTTKGPGYGTGLGLATSFGIVAQSGGTITVESELGAGTTFAILLPHAAEPRAAEGNAGGPATLMVEDGPSLRTP